MFVFVYSSYHLNLQIVLNTRKDPFLNQAPRKMLANFFYPQKSQSLKINVQTSKNPSIIPVTYSLEIWITPLGPSPPLHFLKSLGYKENMFLFPLN